MIENTILSSLIYDEEYARKVLPYVSRDYFDDVGQQVCFKLIKDHYAKYNNAPTAEMLAISLQQTNLKEKVFEGAQLAVGALARQPVDQQWLIDSTEEFCKKQALYGAVMKSADLLAANNTSQYGTMLDLMQKALAVNFDNKLGHDYLLDAEERFRAYSEPMSRLPCDLETFNKFLRGGFLEEALTVFLAPTGVGKSLFLCHFAAGMLMQGKNVLYITMEMSERQVAERIDANLLDIPIENLADTDTSGLIKRMNRLRLKALGKLIVKGFPAHSAHAGHFRHTVNEMIMKKGIRPDAIFVDYLGICGSERAPKTANSYERLKTIAEEVRGIGQEFKCRTFSGAQVNKEGTKNIDFDITDTAESWGLPATCDYLYGLVGNPELELLGKIKIKRMKERFNDIVKVPAFMIGLDRAKMRLYDLDDYSVTDISGEEATQTIPKSKSKYSELVFTE